MVNVGCYIFLKYPLLIYYHYVTALGLTLYSIPREVGLTYATITHGAQMIMLIILGLVSFMILFSVQRKAMKAGSESQTKTTVPE